ncbi:PqqD family protein [Arcticibacterium luteifluviistationis]|uniref:PqqD family protein n=1 Tax=Arcticibacterium luteifluviistationis TaxID=1784714 RepID=A0A2Z4G888_9BACT|nr:PqqD family protein [Arcticibacterium luteifluviistationis]AWV97402.1 PqqD family protein [Arcticibacterium luteifluviistationis]
METTYKLSDKQVSTSLSGESVILNHEKGSYYTLNEVGTFVWKTLETKEATEAELITGILENFDVVKEECTADLNTLLDDLINEGLVEKTK